MESDETTWPDWWLWQLELSSHLLKRMLDRSFSETDLRQMLEDAAGHRADSVEGRWMIETRLRGIRWEIIVEPLFVEKILLIITAYPVQ